VDNSFDAEPFKSIKEELAFASWVSTNFVVKRSVRGIRIYQGEDAFAMIDANSRVLAQLILKDVELFSKNLDIRGPTTEISYAWTNKEFRKSSYIGDLMRMVIRDLANKTNILSDGIQSDDGARAWIRSLIREWSSLTRSPDGVIPGVSVLKITDNYKVLSHRPITREDVRLGSDLFSESGDENERIFLYTQQ
jgi:hypothetical protein